MRKILCALALFLLATALWGIRTASAQSGGFPDKSCVCHAIALDKARGWEGDECGEPIYKNANCGVGDNVNKEAYISDSFRDNACALSGEILGTGKTNCSKKLAGFVQNAAVGSIASYIDTMYANPPATTMEYAYDLLHNAGFVKPAYAQGIGYSGLMPLLPIWKAFRNISYIILVFIMVVLGFMIMFRMKVDAQTAISIQSALPGIIITLVLITFSYAIVGLLIDLMYFLILAIISIFHQSGILLDTKFLSGEIFQMEEQSAREFYLNSNIVSLWTTVWSKENFEALPNALVTLDWFSSVHEADNWLKAASGSIVGFVFVNIGGGIIMYFLTAMALLFTFVRLLFMFINAYIQIILATILAPFYLMLGAIPGRSAFQNWFLGLVGNLIIFPAATALFIIGNSLSALALSGEYGTIWSPPFIVGPTAEGNATNILVGLIGLGIILLTPGILSTLKGSFAPKSALPISPGILFRPVASTVQTVGGLAQQHYALRPLIPKRWQGKPV